MLHSPLNVIHLTVTSLFLHSRILTLASVQTDVNSRERSVVSSSTAPERPYRFTHISYYLFTCTTQWMCDLGRQFFIIFFLFFFVSKWITRTTRIIWFFFEYSCTKFCSVRRLVVVAGGGRGGSSSSVTQHICTNMYFDLLRLRETNLVRICAFVPFNLLAFAEMTISSSHCYGRSDHWR